MDCFNWIFWAIVGVVCFCLELTTGGFYIICFAVGALLTIPFCFFIEDALYQALFFAILSFICLLFVRPVLLKSKLHSRSTQNLSNADALVGEVGYVSTSIPADRFGRVVARGDDWKAKSENNEPLEKGTKVVVVGRQSVVLTVKKLIN